jgi:hypothetical protein
MKSGTSKIVFGIIMAAVSSSVFLLGSKCDPNYGSAKKGTIEYFLNPFKNRTTAPDHFDSSISLTKILAKGNDTSRFENSDAATIQGYVSLVKLAGPESCNCDKPDPSDLDLHIEIALTPNVNDKSKLMIVEITPKIRAKESWNIDTLKLLTGHLVKFSGWMMFDAIHADVSANTATRSTIERATAWEVHPVTSYQIIK